MYKMNHEIWKVQEEREAKIEAEVEAYWDERSERFSEVRQKELKSPDAAAWLSHLTKQLPKGRTLRILDIGTGSGFFSILLAGEGAQPWFGIILGVIGLVLMALGFVQGNQQKGQQPQPPQGQQPPQ